MKIVNFFLIGHNRSTIFFLLKKAEPKKRKISQFVLAAKVIDNLSIKIIFLHN